MHYINSTLPPLNVSKKLEHFFFGYCKDAPVTFVMRIRANKRIQRNKNNSRQLELPKNRMN